MRIVSIVAALLLISAGIARAHSMLERAEPRVGSTIEIAPHEVVLSFSQKIEIAFSTVEVTDAAGHRVDEGKPAVDGNVMRVPIEISAPGTYRVKWHVLSVDTHTTDGAFTFQVRP